MNSNQAAALQKLLDENPGHSYQERFTPAEVVVGCTCKKWKRSFSRRMNAMARVSKQMGAFTQHLKSLSEPCVADAGTRLSSAYTAGLEGLPRPGWCGPAGSLAGKAWRRGRDERKRREQGS